MRSSRTTGQVVLRVDAHGVVCAHNQVARALLGTVVGRRCEDVVCARSRSFDAVCAEHCAARLMTDGEGHFDRLVVTPDSEIRRLTCTRVGDELVVVLTPTGRDARAYERRLTVRERQVLELVAMGMSNPEIGEALGLGRATVRSHVERIFEKLDATTRTEASLTAIEVGEIDG
jgi:DNA-binding CsgD family transcriptional regulator